MAKFCPRRKRENKSSTPPPREGSTENVGGANATKAPKESPTNPGCYEA